MGWYLNPMPSTLGLMHNIHKAFYRVIEPIALSTFIEQLANRPIRLSRLYLDNYWSQKPSPAITVSHFTAIFINNLSLDHLWVIYDLCSHFFRTCFKAVKITLGVLSQHAADASLTFAVQKVAVMLCRLFHEQLPLVGHFSSWFSSKPHNKCKAKYKLFCNNVKTDTVSVQRGTSAVLFDMFQKVCTDMACG